MTYGLSPRAFIENGPAVKALEVSAANTTARLWRALTAECRLAEIERALHAANDADPFRIAL
jgi:hypothetical protein